MVTLKTDDRGRVKLPGAGPGQVFVFETDGQGKISLVEVRPKEAPVVKPVKGPNGLYRLPAGVKLDKREIAAAIRADRDAR